MASPATADPYGGCRLSAVVAPSPNRRCHFALGSRPTCPHPEGASPLYSCTLANGEVRHFHKPCIPPRLLYHAAPHGRFLHHISGLTQYLLSTHSPHYLHDLDARLKADCADVAKDLDGAADSGGAVSERELSLFVDQSVASHFSCLICVDKVVHHPVSTGCHVFCRHCWDEWVLSSTPPQQRETVPCPVCRTSVSLAQVVPCEKVIQRVIASLRVRCVHASKGCSVVTEFGIDGEKARAHARESCPHLNTVCSRCDWKGRHQQLASHHCNPPRPCPHAGCQRLGSPEWLAQHIRQCPYVPLRCSTCNRSHPRSEQSTHERGHCVYRCKHCHRTIPKAESAEHDSNPQYRLCKEFSPCANGCGAPVLQGVQPKHNDTCEEAWVDCRLCPATAKRRNYPRHYEKVHEGRDHMQDRDSDDDYYH